MWRGTREELTQLVHLYHVLSTYEGRLEDYVLITRRYGVGGFGKGYDPRFGDELA